MTVGVDDPVLLEDPTPWQERLLDALHAGIPDAMLPPLARSLGASPDEAERFIAGIRPALDATPGPELRVQVELPSEIRHGEAEALDRGWRAGGLDPSDAVCWRRDDLASGRALVIVADRLVDPRRAAALMAADIVHVPMELAGDAVVVGPVVVPGVTACLACRNAHRTDLDPGWPLLAAQLLGREHAVTEAGVADEAAVLAARLLRAAAPGATALRDAPTPGEAPVTTFSVTVSARDVRRTWRAHRPHPRCRCRDLEERPPQTRSAPPRSRRESANAPEDAHPTAATTTATASAPPA